MPYYDSTAECKLNLRLINFLGNPDRRGSFTLEIQAGKGSIGLITSRCLGKEPVLLPRMHSCTGEDSLVSPNKSHRHKLPRQFGLQPGMADNVELINSIQENFRAN